MTEQPSSGTGDAGPVPDLEYDLAHEAKEQNCFGAGCPPRAGRPPAVQVVTRTGDYDGDYGYDLAHDIPRPTRPGDGDRRRR